MNDNQLLRYSRHILLDEIGIEGQQALLDAHVLVIGAGGLGSPAAMYLASAGVGKLTLVDDDTVDLTNLQRQIAHTTARVGQPKVLSARETLTGINPEIEIVALQERLDGARLAELVLSATVVLDCTDNFATRHAVNRACVAGKVPLFFANVASSLGHIQAGKLRPLAVTSAVRARSLPDVPTMAQAGVADYEVLEWNPVLAPAGIAPEVRTQLVNAIRKALADPEVLGRIRALGGDAFPDATQASAGKFIQAQQAQWGKVIRERKIVVG